MPVYNCEKYLHEALESVLGQTYKNIEVICVDDGSTDDSLKILREHRKRDNRVKVIQQQNQFAGVARNNGLKIVSGKYVMFLDSDDIFEKNMISSLVKIAESKKTDIVFFGFYHFKNDTKHRSLMGIPYTSSKVISSKEHSKDLFQIGQGVPWNRLYNVEFIKKTELQFQNLQSNNDVFFSKAIMLYADRMYFSKKRYVNYRISNDNSLQGNYKPQSGNFALCLEALYLELVKSNLYNLYKDTFEKYVVESFLLTFVKASDMITYEAICKIEQDSLFKMQIRKESAAIVNNPAKAVFEYIIDGKYEEALFALYRYMQDNYTAKDSIESRVGRKLLKIFRVKNYD